MNFRTFLENLDRIFSLSWRPRTKTWENGSGGHYSLFGQQYNKWISFEGGTQFDPQVREAVAILAQQYPQLLNYTLDFDGHKVGTIRDYLLSEHQHMPDKWYHGTSEWHLERAKNVGLQARGKTNVEPSYQMGADPSNPALIYLAATPGNAVRFAAREASRKAPEKTSPVIIEIDNDKLDPDFFIDNINLSPYLL